MKKKQRGFTMIEIIIVVALVGVLAGLGSFMITKSMNSSRIKVAETELEMLASAILQMAWDTGRWPNGALRTEEVQGINEIKNLSGGALFQIESEKSFPNWKGPYYEGSLVDPWGEPYFFDSDYLVGGKMRIVVGSGGPNCSGVNRYDKDNIYVLLDD